MGSGLLRRDRGFGARVALPLSSFPVALIVATTPAAAQGFATGAIGSVMPIAVAVGGASFGVIALLLLRRARQAALGSARRDGERIAALRATVDQYEALLAGGREITVIFGASGPEAALGPKVLGRGGGLLRPGQRPDTLLKFSTWLPEASAEGLATALDRLRIDGRGFDLPLKTKDGVLVRATGMTVGGGAVLRISSEARTEIVEPQTTVPVVTAFRPALTSLPEPAYLRNRDGDLVFGNDAYLSLCDELELEGSAETPPELFATPPSGLGGAGSMIDLGEAGRFALIEFPLPGGTGGVLVPRQELDLPLLATDPGHIGGLIDALATPVAIFNERRELVQSNRAYADLWGLDPKWLHPGLEERTILDRLRTDGLLPSVADYHAWRGKYLTSTQGLTAPREIEPWHLPDGRTINVIAAPASPQGGIIYVFEDITQQLRLKSLNKALLDVQRSTINALTEAVAVFGTNGRLTLSNPRLSTIWKLPSNELGQNPHIDRLAEVCGRSLTDGYAIWSKLKHSIIDLNPNRGDTNGRFERDDGKLIDYNVVRLPDGQTMLTFLDVTDSAHYSQVLKERNEALETADRLKDAFVQNVSYELRSPLTNIIGFADLLASDEVGPLTARQRSYTDYIRASSVTLGVLIDNILDLANVDAGIAELNPEPQDVRELVDKARGGLAATFPEVNGQRPFTLEVDIPDPAPSLIADGTRLVQVLYNLLSNAGRYSPPGASIRLVVSARGERVLFAVEDEGNGMSDGLRDPQNGGRQRGGGLGLAIVKTFVSLHGGTVTVERRQPKGSRVVVNLPADASAVAASRRA